MKLKLLLTFVFMFAFAAIPAVAGESGAKDTIDMVITVQPDAGASQYNVQLQLWVFDDADTISGAAMGFGWDNPKLQMTGATNGPAATSGFTTTIFYDGGSVATTNANKRFCFVGIRLFTPGVTPFPTRQHWATYNFAVDASWTNADVIHLDTFTYGSGVNYKFVSSTGGDYFPYWTGALDITDANPSTPKSLQLSTDTLRFFGVVNGTNPDPQYFTVSEVSFDTINYTASVTPGTWVTLDNATGTTPADVQVNANISGLGEGVHILPITVTSPEAENSPLTLYAKLTLEPQPVLVVPTDTLKFYAVANGDNPAMQTFPVTEIDGEAIAYNATVIVGNSWITLGNASGTTPADVEVNIDITGVAEGTYDGTIQVAAPAAANTPQPVYIRLFVEPQPMLAVSVDTLYFNAVENGANPAGQPFSVTEVYEGTIPYNAAVTVGDSWITLNNASGTTPGDVNVNINISGVPSGDYLGTIEVVSDTVANSPQFVYVKLSISAEAVLLVPTDTLEFTAVANGDNPGMQSFLVAMSDDSNVDYAATVPSGAGWIILGNAAGQTPNNVNVNIDIFGVMAGEYFDSVQVASEGVANSPVFVFIKLTMANQPMLAVSPDTLKFTAVENETNPDPQTFAVNDFYGGNIPYAASVILGDTWISLDNAVGTTPNNVQVNIDITDVAVGTYDGTVEIVSDTASNSPVTVYIVLTVVKPACVDIVLSENIFNFTAVEGGASTIPSSDQFTITSSNPVYNFNYEILPPIGDDYTWIHFSVNSQTATPAPVIGTTPSTIDIIIDPTGLTEGNYSIPFIVQSDYDNLCSSTPLILTINIEVLPPPSADTLVVHDGGVSPGGKVTVPVTFTNSCPLKAMGAVLNWSSVYIHLDSVSFANSVINYFDTKTVVINNELHTVAINCDAGVQEYYPRNSQQNFIDLHFSISCDAEETVYLIEFSEEVTDIAFFERDCGSGLEIETPITFAGSIIVETKPFDFCGWVVEEGTGNSIPGATVELYAYPLDFNNTPVMTAITGGIGSFLFENVETLPFSLWAYKEGYYPEKVEQLDILDKGVMIHLTPIDNFAFEPHPWFVNYYCETNIYYDAAVPVGSYVEARDGMGNLCGQFLVTTPGLYGFMPVYQDDDQTPEIEGIVPGQMVHFFINGEEATTMDNTIYPIASSMPPYQHIQVCLEVGVVIIHTCDLSEGWNLISWNINTENDIEAVFGPYMDNIDVILGFEQGGLTYDPELLKFSTLHYVDHLSGYWVKVKPGHAFTMEFEGSPVQPNTPIMLTRGWNLVSYLPEVTYPTETALENLYNNGTLLVGLGFDDSLMVYRPDWQFSTLLEMSPCHGYWIKVSDNDYLVYPGGAGLVPVPAVHPKVLAMAALNAADVTPTNQWLNLYSSNLTLNDEIVQAGATISAHTADGTKIGSFTLSKAGEFGFMPVYADLEGSGLKSGEKFYLQIDGVEVSETLTWTNNGDRIEVNLLSAKTNTTENLPGTYTLAQNYPNPFNPSTIINFTMAAEGRATIEIYNILGKVVAVPFDGIAKSGINEITWNGTNSAGEKVASGIYLYRLTAGNFSETKKMMLLK